MATQTAPATSLRLARRYAPQVVAQVLHEIAGATRLGLVLDLDALERTRSLGVDRVMLLALDGLVQANVDIVFAATATRVRAQLLRRSLWPVPALVEAGPEAIAQARRALANAALVVVSDDEHTATALSAEDRGLWIGTTIAPTAVRASLWCLLHERTNALRQRSA